MRLLMVGAGNMGGAMLRRWLDTGMSAGDVTVVSPSGRAMPHGICVLPAIPDVRVQTFDTIMLGVKPQQLDLMRGGPLAGHAPQVLISILAGVEEATLAPLCDAHAIVRAMPNLPVGIGKGVVALHSSSADAGVRAAISTLMQPLGLVEWIADEAQFDDVTALAGCGPGFVFRFADALAQAGAALGLNADQAARLALATLEGAAIMARAETATPATLADRVASPGGSTRQGLNVLDHEHALVTLVTETLAASARRNREMAAAAR